MAKTPDLMQNIKVKRGPGRPPKKPAPNANEIASSIEAEARRMLEVAAALRGNKVK